MFRVNASRYGMGNDEGLSGPVRTVTNQPKPEPQLTVEEIPTLYAFVTENCTCGNCYRTLAKNDRVPWRSTARNDSFVNSKHGTIYIKNCAVNKFVGSGYIYVPPAQQAIDDSNNLKANQLRDKKDHAAHEKAIRNETLVKSRHETRIVEERSKAIKIKNDQQIAQDKLKAESRMGELKALECQRSAEYKNVQAKINKCYEEVKAGGFTTIEGSQVDYMNWCNYTQFDYRPKNGKELRADIERRFNFQFGKQKELEVLRGITKKNRGLEVVNRSYS
jgi:hypothetical protein